MVRHLARRQWKRERFHSRLSEGRREVTVLPTRETADVHRMKANCLCIRAPRPQGVHRLTVRGEEPCLPGTMGIHAACRSRQTMRGGLLLRHRGEKLDNDNLKLNDAARPGCRWRGRGGATRSGGEE